MELCRHSKTGRGTSPMGGQDGWILRPDGRGCRQHERSWVRLGSACVLPRIPSEYLEDGAEVEYDRLYAGSAVLNRISMRPAAESSSSPSAGPKRLPPFRTTQPVSARAFDMIYTHPAYHSKGLAGIAEILPFGIDKLPRDSGVWGFIDGVLPEDYNHQEYRRSCRWAPKVITATCVGH